MDHKTWNEVYVELITGLKDALVPKLLSVEEVWKLDKMLENFQEDYKAMEAELRYLRWKTTNPKGIQISMEEYLKGEAH